MKSKRKILWPEKPKTLGEHLKRKRLMSGLLQKEVALKLGVCKQTYMEWEKDKYSPSIQHWPQLIAFLGYTPYPKPRSLGGYILDWRRQEGLTLKELSQTVGIDPGTLTLIETDNYTKVDVRVEGAITRLKERFGLA